MIGQIKSQELPQTSSYEFYSTPKRRAQSTRGHLLLARQDYGLQRSWPQSCGTRNPSRLDCAGGRRGAISLRGLSAASFRSTSANPQHKPESTDWARFAKQRDLANLLIQQSCTARMPRQAWWLWG